MKALALLLILFQQSIILHAQDQQKLLDHAYKTKSKTELKQFFDNWHNEIPPISDSEFVKLSDIQKETYKVFEAFYHPENLSVLTGKDEEANLYKDATFLLLKNSILIGYPDQISITYNDSDSSVVHHILSIVHNDSERLHLLLRQRNGRLYDSVIRIYGFPFLINHTLFEDSIINFRPKIDCPDRTPIFLNTGYTSTLNRFLKKGNLVKKMDFLGLFARISHPFLNVSYVLFSNPMVSKITFDNTMQRAKLYFTFNGNTSVVVLKKENAIWKIVGSKWHWVY